MKTKDEILDEIKNLITSATTFDEDDFTKIQDDLKNRLDVDILLGEEIPEGGQMSDILTIWAGISWDGMESSGVNIGISGEQIIEKIKDEVDPIFDGQNRVMNYLDYALAFKQIGKRLEALAKESKKEGDRMKPRNRTKPPI